jgi:hypothetical protein
MGRGVEDVPSKLAVERASAGTSIVPLKYITPL